MKPFNLIKTLIISLLFFFIFVPSIFAQNMSLSLPNKNFSKTENPKITINKKEDSNLSSFINRLRGKKTLPLKETIKVKVTNPKGVEVPQDQFNIVADSNNQIQIVIGNENLIPGKYYVNITETSTNEVINQNFTWGVLAINPDQSVYSIGDTALLSMAVLDDKGNMVCDANLSLVITNPDKSVTILSTNNQLVQVNPICHSKDLTLIPDYQSTYSINQTGTYSLRLTATTPNGTYSITDSFQSEINPDFIIKRITATRIYPINTYPVTLEITANKDFSGTISESVPNNFIITQTTAKISQENNRQILTWNISLKKDTKTNLSYSYKAPFISPEYYLLGPIEIKDSTNIVFTENRQWQIASDAVTETITSVGSSNWMAPANVYSVHVQAWGAGGGGGDGQNGYGGAGGGGGAFVAGTMAVIPGNTYPLVIGKGGTAGSGSGAGGSGASTTFNSTSFVAKGGGGGGGSTGSSVGAGGLASESTGTTKTNGGDGGAGNNTSSDAGGGGGGAAGPHGVGITGGNASSTIGGHGGRGDNNNGGVGGIAVNGSVGATGASNSLGGGGGSGGDNGTAGGAGGSPGGGAGGGEANAVAAIGGNGQIVLTYTANNPPNTPTNTTPSNGAIGISRNPTLIASSYSDSEGDSQNASQWQVATDSSFSSIVFDTGTSGSASNTVNVGYTLSYSTLYYWRVRYQAVQGNWSDYSGATAGVGTSFTTMSAPQSAPNTPTLVSPGTGTTNTSVTPSFQTVTTDANSDNLQYEVKICTDSDMTTGCQTFTAANAGWSGANIGTSSYSSGTTATYVLQTGNSLAENTIYYWKTRAIDPAGTNTWSSTQVTAFSTTTGQRPNTPTLISPANGATGVTESPSLFTVATDSNGDNLQYKIELCTNSAMSVGCTTYDITSTNVGWSGMNVGTSAFSSGSTATYTLQTSLAVGTTFYWRSYALDYAGLNRWSSTQGSPYSFVTTPGAPANQAPLTPNLVSPSNGATGVTQTPTFKTSTSDPESDNLQYEIKICTDSAMTTGCQTLTAANAGWSGADVGTSSYSSGSTATYILQVGNSLAANTIYYWKTRATDPAGSNTWSSTQGVGYSFTTLNNAPYQPTSPTPATGTTAVSFTPTLSASAFSDPDTGDTQQASQWQVATDSGFSNIVFDTGTSGSASNSVNVTTTLSVGTTYYWHVRYQDAQDDWSPYLTTANFVTNRAPLTPSLISPTDSSTGVTQTPIFKTATSDTDNNNLQYEIKICTDSGMSANCQTFTAANAGWSGADVGTSAYSSGTTATYILPVGSSLAANTLYYWKTRAIDYSGSNTYSSTQTTPYSFTTLNNSPNTPTNSSPGVGVTAVSLTPTLSASAFSDPDTGDTQQASQWQVATDSGFSNIVFDTGTSGSASNSVNIATTLSVGTTYYWHVRYQDSQDDWSSYSSTTNFMTRRAPNKPTNSTPGVGTTNVSLTPTLTASAFSGGEGNDTQSASQWQVATDSGFSNIVFDTGTTGPATNSVNITTTLSVGTTYYWHVRYETNPWSEYSTSTFFITGSGETAPPSPLNPLRFKGVRIKGIRFR